jgi:putative transposase
MEAHNGKCIIRYILQHKLRRAEWTAAAGEIDLKYLDESGFCAWSKPSYTYYQKSEQKRLQQTKTRGRRLSIVGLLEP